MKPQETSIQLLNKLIRANRDRASGYRKVLGLLQQNDIDLASLFNNIAETSSLHAQLLSDHVIAFGGDPTAGYMKQGRSYRTWMDLYSNHSGNDRRSILSLCEKGEEMILQIYSSVLSADVNLPRAVVDLVSVQKERIQQEHDMVNRLSDMHAIVK